MRELNLATSSKIKRTIAMKTFIVGAAVAALIAGAAGSAIAAPYQSDDANRAQASNTEHHGWAQDRGGNHHWRRGERMGYNDWSSAQPVDYREHHLRRPPHGYEWRESNGRYVLAAVATGVIASMVLSH